jgi:hypothetical protein
VFLASTNYPDRLDRRFVDRPSRFDTIRYVGMPTGAARRAYLKTKEPSLTDWELALWVDLTEEFSLAHLRDLIIAVRCFGQPSDKARRAVAEHAGGHAEQPEGPRPAEDRLPERRHGGPAAARH